MAGCANPLDPGGKRVHGRAVELRCTPQLSGSPRSARVRGFRHGVFFGFASHIRAAVVVIVVVVVGFRRLRRPWPGAARTPPYAQIGTRIVGSDWLHGAGARVELGLAPVSGGVPEFPEIDAGGFIVEFEHRPSAAVMRDHPLGDEAAFDGHHLARAVFGRLGGMAMRRRGAVRRGAARALLVRVARIRC